MSEDINLEDARFILENTLYSYLDKTDLKNERHYSLVEDIWLACDSLRMELKKQ